MGHSLSLSDGSRTCSKLLLSTRGDRLLEKNLLLLLLRDHFLVGTLSRDTQCVSSLTGFVNKRAASLILVEAAWPAELVSDDLELLKKLNIKHIQFDLLHSAGLCTLASSVTIASTPQHPWYHLPWLKHFPWQHQVCALRHHWWCCFYDCQHCLHLHCSQRRGVWNERVGEEP